MADPGLSSLPEADWERSAPAVALGLPELEGLLSHALPGARLQRATPLAGGLANSTWRLDTEREQSLVLRLYQREPAACARELALFQRLPAQVALAPLRHAAPEHDPPFALFGLVPGERLELALRDSPQEASQLGAVVGEVLATIHAVRFPSPGFLNAGLEVPEPWASIRETVDGYLGGMLEGLPGKRLGKELRLETECWIAENLGRLDALEGDPRLAHADFKPTNLLVDRGERGWRVSAVLDWEFAFAFTPLFDVGQLLRHPAPVGFEEAFAEAYRSAGGELPDGWRTTSRLLDLMNLLGFLEGETERPNVQRSCRALVQASVSGSRD